MEDIERQIADIEQELEDNPAWPDVSALSAVLKAAQRSGDVASRINAAEIALGEANANIQRHLTALNPQVADEHALTSIPVPPRDTIVRHRDAVLNADRKIEVCRERIISSEQEYEHQQKARERLVRDEDAIGAEEITDARTRRDTGWALVRRRYVDGTALPDAEIQAFTGPDGDLPKTFEAAIEAADMLADRRFSRADAAAQMTIISREIIKSQDQLNSLRQEEQKLLEARQSLDSSWLEMWAEAPFKPLSPDAMLEWLNRRDEVLEAASRRDGSQLHLEALRQEETATKASILVELTAIAVDTEALQSQPLRVVIEAAAAWQGRHETNASRRRQSEDRLRKIKPEKERKRQALEAAEKAQADWQTQWSATVLALSLDPGVQTEAAAAQLEDIDRLRETAREIDQLRNERIGRIERDIDAFAQDVKPLIAALASDLENTTPEEAIVTLERRLEDAKRVRDQRKAKDITIANLEKRIEEFEGSVLQARETIRNLCETASVTDIDQLRIAIRNSDHLRELNQNLSTVAAALTREGDGLTTNELIEECAIADIDQIVAREETLQEDLKNLRAQFIEAAECRTRTRNALNAFGGEARAAEAAAVRQTALAEMREAVEEYIRVRTSATLLQWAIERYRREKQAPLLKRAAEIFAVLTGGSFIDLRLEFDEQDNPHLAGLRADGQLVRVTGMSTGTADQLYLALRVSSIEDYLGRASAVPFVVDDLFINFDNERAAAGFKVLGDLAKKTQILFFTHHNHLVEIARSTLGNSVNIVPLLDRGLALAA